jgi:RNA polymerase sigma-70 factor (ECF subfamily)
VEDARRGDAAARERLVDRWLPTVLQWCARLGGPKVDAEDAAHDVMVIVLTRLDGVRETEHFSSWLFGVTRRVLASHRRVAWVRRWMPGIMPEAIDPTAGPAQRSELSETSRRVQSALEELPEAQREVLVLCDLEDRTDTEVAAMLQIPVGTARSRLRLARERFRRSARRHQLAPDLLEVASGGRP